MRKPLRNTEKTLAAKGRDFLRTMEELRRRISSYSTELCMASFANRCFSARCEKLIYNIER
jgi:hypothetical protein